MPTRSWHEPVGLSGEQRDATFAHVIEAIESNAPQTKAELAATIDSSEHAVSDLLGTLKSDGLVSKGYVVDREAVYESAQSISALHADTDHDREWDLLEDLKRLDDVTIAQYEAAQSTFAGESPDQTPNELESLANERCGALLDDLKSYTLTMGWPANRVAADIATITTNLELVGDYACFIHDSIDAETTGSSGFVGEKAQIVFDSGWTVHEHFVAILFEGELMRFDALQETEGGIHRHLDELYELVTASDIATFGRLLPIIRGLERAIYYWVNAAELSIQVMTGIEPGHFDC